MMTAELEGPVYTEHGAVAVIVHAAKCIRSEHGLTFGWVIRRPTVVLIETNGALALFDPMGGRLPVDVVRKKYPEAYEAFSAAMVRSRHRPPEDSPAPDAPRPLWRRLMALLR